MANKPKSNHYPNCGVFIDGACDCRELQDLQESDSESKAMTHPMKDLTLPTPALPPLPEADLFARELTQNKGGIWLGCHSRDVTTKAHDEGETGDEVREYFTAEQMQDYARAALSRHHEDGRASTDKESLTVGDFNLSVTDAEGREWRLMPVEATREMCLADWPSKVTLSDAHTDWGVSEVVWREMGKLAPRFEGALGGEKGEAVAWMWQHDETGSVGFIDPWQKENGWEQANPRLKIIGPLFAAPVEARMLTEWQPISTAPKTQKDGAAEVVIMGFAPDEEGYSPESCEGFWSPIHNEWRFYGDPTWSSPPQPTHWQPRLAPPVGSSGAGGNKGDV